MHKSLKKILLGTGFAAVSLLTLTSASWSMNHGMGIGHDPDRLLMYMSDHLDLSEQQHSAIKALLTDAEQNTSADRQRLKDLRRELRQQEEEFDEGQVQSMAEEIGQITTRLIYQAVSTKSQVQALLTPEQQQQMQRVMEKRSERRDKWKRRHASDSDE